MSAGQLGLGNDTFSGICGTFFFWEHLAKSYILKSSPNHTCYTTNTIFNVYLISLIFTQFTYFPQDVSEMHTSFHSTELQLILHSGPDANLIWVISHICSRCGLSNKCYSLVLLRLLMKGSD